MTSQCGAVITSFLVSLCRCVRLTRIFCQINDRWEVTVFFLCVFSPPSPPPFTRCLNIVICCCISPFNDYITWRHRTSGSVWDHTITHFSQFIPLISVPHSSTLSLPSIWAAIAYFPRVEIGQGRERKLVNRTPATLKTPVCAGSAQEEPLAPPRSTCRCVKYSFGLATRDWVVAAHAAGS